MSEPDAERTRQADRARDEAFALLLACAAWWGGRIRGAAAGLVAKIPPGAPADGRLDAACIAQLREPLLTTSDALELTPEGRALIARGWPSSHPDGDVRGAIARVGDFTEAQLQSLAFLLLDGLRCWQTFGLLSGDLQASMADDVSFDDARNSAPALFMRGETAAEELLGLACEISGQPPDQVRAQVDAIARAMLEPDGPE